MKIVVVGPGAMGLLYGGYLSKHNEVFMLGRNQENMNLINQNGIVIKENEGEATYRVHATTNPKDIGEADLVITFVKTYNTGHVLENYKEIIGDKTILMSLQNGLGNEQPLLNYAKPENIIVGNTNQGSSRNNAYSITHSGLGKTFLGVVCGEAIRFKEIADNFTKCGFECELSDDVRKLIWNKLMINASSSVLSGVLQVPQGYVVENEYAWNIEKKLIEEICDVANADGYCFSKEEQIERLRNHLKNAPTGLTSIYHDIKNKRQTEVDVINGAVVAVAHRLNISVPTHEIMVNLVKAMGNT